MTTKKNLRHCMVDIETLSNEFNAVILSIGAVQFDPDGGVGDKFYKVINVQSCLDAGMGINKETLAWWSKQNKEAQKVLIEAKNSPLTLAVALHELAVWSNGLGLKHWWSNGASFDLPIIKQAYINCKMVNEVPWKFWDEMCVRTITTLFPVDKPTRQGVYHNALDDSLFQIEHVQKCFKGDD
jgi:hypothetical protein